MKFTPKQLTLALAAILLAPAAQAKPTYFHQLQAVYPNSPAIKKFMCKVCHPSGDPRPGPYGMALFRAMQGKTFSQAAQLVDGIDSDGDGRTNGDELRNGTNPSLKD